MLHGGAPHPRPRGRGWPFRTAPSPAPTLRVCGRSGRVHRLLGHRPLAFRWRTGPQPLQVASGRGSARTDATSLGSRNTPSGMTDPGYLTHGVIPSVSRRSEAIAIHLLIEGLGIDVGRRAACEAG